MEPNILSLKEQDLIREWVARFLEMLELIEDVADGPSPPPGSREISYSNERVWLKEHEAQVLPIWRLFETWYRVSGRNDERLSRVSGPLEGNPFQAFYRSMSVSRFAVHAGMQDEKDGGTLIIESPPGLRMNRWMASCMARAFRRWACDDPV
jgi:hypothetical protein